MDFWNSELGHQPCFGGLTGHRHRLGLGRFCHRGGLMAGLGHRGDLMAGFHKERPYGVHICQWGR